MTQAERDDFRQFCENATDSQVIEIFKKESQYPESDCRVLCAEIARGVAISRGLWI